MNNILTVGEAITKMQELTKRGQPFSFTYYSYNSRNKQSRGKIHVAKAFIRKQAKPVDGVPSVLLEYKDVAQQSFKRCYICLIVEFNGIKTVLR